MQFGLVLVGLSSVLRDNHQGTTQGQVVLGRHFQIHVILSQNVVVLIIAYVLYNYFYFNAIILAYMYAQFSAHLLIRVVLVAYFTLVREEKKEKHLMW